MELKMPKPSEIIEEVKTVYGLFGPILPWITKTKLRISLVTNSLLLIPLMAIAIIILSLFGVAKEHKDIQKLDLERVDLKNKVAVTIDYLNICQQASSKSIRHLYCEIGELYYINNISKLINDKHAILSQYNEKIINLNGYEAMIINMNYLLRTNEIDNIKSKNKPHWFEQLLMTISPKFSTVTILLFYLIIISICAIPYFVMTNKIKRYQETELE